MMANEISAVYTTGRTLYAVFFNATGQVWTGSAFAALSGATWTDCDVAMTEVGTTGIYQGTVPATIVEPYTAVIYEQAGATPATTDNPTHTLAESGPVYSVQIQFHRNGASQDVWTAAPREWDGGTRRYKPMTGITSVTLTANKSSDGTALFSAQAMTQVGATGVYKYAATAVVTRGDPAAWSCSVVRSGVTLTFNGVSGRDK